MCSVKSKKLEAFIISCPICDVDFRSTTFWGHLNNFHISRNVWPEVSFLEQHHRLVCTSCKYCYNERWIRSGCRRAVGSGKRCGGKLCYPSELSLGVFSPQTSQPVSDSPVITNVTDITDEPDVAMGNNSLVLDPIIVGIQAASSVSSPPNEAFIFSSLMNEIITLSVSTISHIPRKVRPLLAQVFCNELQHAHLDGIWGFARLFLLPKAVLRPPPRGGRKKRYVVAGLIIERLHRWLNGDLEALWLEARKEASRKTSTTTDVDLTCLNARRAIRLTQEGRYKDAMRALVANGKCIS